MYIKKEKFYLCAKRVSLHIIDLYHLHWINSNHIDIYKKKKTKDADTEKLEMKVFERGCNMTNVEMICIGLHVVLPI